MNTVTLPKTEYKKIVDTQKKLRSQIISLREFVIEQTRDELKPSIIKKLQKLSADIDKGEGKHFRSLSSFKTYFSKP